MINVRHTPGASYPGTRHAAKHFNTPNGFWVGLNNLNRLYTSRGATIHPGIYLNSHEGETIAEDNDPNLNADTAVLVVSKA